MANRGVPASSEQVSVDGVFRKVLTLSPRGQTELYRMLREQLTDVAAPATQVDEDIAKREGAVEAMERVAAALHLANGAAPSTTQFTEQARALGLEWTVSKVGRLFKGWSNAQKFYERRRLPETARQVRQRRYLTDSGRTPNDHLRTVAAWLDDKPPDTSLKAYNDWRAKYIRTHVGSDEALPAHSRHLLRLFPELTWADLLSAAQDPSVDPYELCLQRAEERLRTQPNPLRLVSVPTAAALLGLSVPRFDYARRTGHPKFPQVTGFVGPYAVFALSDVRAYAGGRSAPRRREEDHIQLWTATDVAKRLGTPTTCVHSARHRRAWHLAPEPNGAIAGSAYWVPHEVEAWCSAHPDRCSGKEPPSPA